MQLAPAHINADGAGDRGPARARELGAIRMMVSADFSAAPHDAAHHTDGAAPMTGAKPHACAATPPP